LIRGRVFANAKIQHEESVFSRVGYLHKTAAFPSNSPLIRGVGGLFSYKCAFIIKPVRIETQPIEALPI